MMLSDSLRVLGAQEMDRMTWEFSPAKDSFANIAEEWDAINRSCHNHVLLDSRFVSASLRWLATTEILLGVQKNSPSGGAALLTKTGMGRWQTFQPAQTPLGFIVVRPNGDPQGTLIGLLHALPGLALQLGILQQDPDFSSLLKIPSSDQVELLEYIRTPRLQLAATFEEYWNGRSKNLKHNLSRQRKRLAEQGRPLELVSLRTADAIAEGIREYGRLESQGWKGQAGTAVEENNGQGRFYREVFENFCVTGEAVIYQLLLDGKVVASDLCLKRNNMLVVLKTAYDESIEHVSAALLMRQDIVRQLYEEGMVQDVEFYGRALDWHLKWTDQVRTMYHLNCFRNRWIASFRNRVKKRST